MGEGPLGATFFIGAAAPCPPPRRTAPATLEFLRQQLSQAAFELFENIRGLL